MSSQVASLEKHLQEMLEFRAVLDAQLNDIYMREKPEVRQLIEDVRNAKQTIEETNDKVKQTQQRIQQKRTELVNVQSSPVVPKLIDLLLQQQTLNRRLAKWESLRDTKDGAQEVESYSQKQAQRRNTLKQNVAQKERALLVKQRELEALTSYATLVETILAEHKENWS